MGPIGIFGGTFDPIHFGHLRTALELLLRLSLERVVFIPSARQPLRTSQPLASTATRLRMIRAAVRHEPRFSVDARELGRSGPSYTVDTLTALRRENPRRSLCLLLGMDSFSSLPRWHRWKELAELANIIVAHRPGARTPRKGALADLLARCGTENATEVRDSRAGRVLVTPVTQLDVSASAIRELVAAGADPRYLVPDRVRDIIAITECYAR